MTETIHFDPEVIDACTRIVEDYIDASCDLFGKAADQVLTLAQVDDLASVAALCEQIGLEVGWSDNRPLLTITCAGKPAFAHGEATVSSCAK